MLAVCPPPGAARCTVLQLAAMPAMPQRAELNNIALKWIRDTNERPPGCPLVNYVDLTDHMTLHIGHIDAGKGVAYRFDETKGLQPWSWLKMLKGFKPEMQSRIIGDGLAHTGRVGK